jgi:hypothetical protein
MSTISERAIELAQRRRDQSREHEARGNTETALRLAEEAEEAQGWAELARLAERRLGPFAGSSSASELPPAPKATAKRSRTWARRGRPSNADRLMRGARS